VDDEKPVPNKFRDDARTYVRAIRARDLAAVNYKTAKEQLEVTTREAEAAEKQLEAGGHLDDMQPERERLYRTALVDGEVLMIERDRNAPPPRIKIRLVQNPE
jgi:hypothetical protein